MSIREQLQGKLGFGTAPLGNMYRDIPPAEAIATVDAAWDQGIRFFLTPHRCTAPAWPRSALAKHWPAGRAMNTS